MVLARVVRRALLVLLLMGWSSAAYSQSTPKILLGRVLSADRKPINGAKVSLYGDYRTLETARLFAAGVTDASGKFELHHEPTKELMVIVQSSAHGLCMVRVPGDVEDEPLEIPLSPPSSVRIKVVSPLGAPIPGVRIAPYSMQNQTMTLLAYVPSALMEELAQTSDADGFCTIPNLPRQMRLDFRAAEGLMVGPAVSVEATDAETIDAPNFTATEYVGATIVGRLILSDTGKPAEGVEVTREWTDEKGNRYEWRAFTDGEGKFRFRGVSAGSHVLKVTLGYPLAERYAPHTSAPFPVALRQAVEKEIRLGSGTIMRGMMVMDGTGLPVSGVPVRVQMQTQTQPPRWEPAAATISGADGVYALNVTPGRYRIFASPSPAMGLVLVDQAGRSTFDVENGKDVTLDFVLRSTSASPLRGIAPVKGTVVDSLGQPVEGAIVSLSYGIDNHLQNGISVIGSAGIGPTMGDGATTITDKLGNFELPVAGNGALLRVRKGNRTLAMPQVISDDRDLKLTLVENTAGSLRVHVVDDQAKPMAGAQVIVRVSSGIHELAPHWGSTDADGIFTLSPVYPDRNYRVLVERPGFTTAMALFNAAAGKLTELSPIALYKADSSITGTVLSEAGQPMPLISVTLTGGRAGNKSTQTDAVGHFRFDKLAAGQAVEIRTINAGPASDPHSIEPGTQDVRLVHTPQSVARRGPGPRNAAPTTRQQ